MVRVSEITPGAANEKKQISKKENRSTTPDDGHRIGEETGNANRKDSPTETSIKSIIGHVELFRHDAEPR